MTWRQAEDLLNHLRGDDLLGAAVGQDAAGAHGDHLVPVTTGLVEVVEHRHDRGAQLGVQVAAQLEEVHLVGQVQVGGRLVEQEDVGALGQGHGHPHPLALSAGEGGHVPLGQADDVGAFHGLGDGRVVDDAATSLGLRVGRVHGAMLGYGVVLAAICVATAGPIGFIALAAPQLARWLSRSAGMTLIALAAMGALLLGGADFLVQRLLSPFQIPVGLVSAAVGEIYLVWLLMAPLGRAERAG